MGVGLPAPMPVRLLPPPSSTSLHLHLPPPSPPPSSQVLLDTLLLSRCDYLLKSSSAVSEFALYFAPRLIARTHDFSFEAGSPWGSPAGLPATNGRGGAPPWAWEPQPAKERARGRRGAAPLRRP